MQIYLFTTPTSQRDENVETGYAEAYRSLSAVVDFRSLIDYLKAAGRHSTL